MTENTSKQPSPDGIVFHPHPKNKKFRDLTGEVYNHFTVLGYAGKRALPSQLRTWYVQCECGTIKVVEATNLKRGSIKSCGCKKFHYNSIAHKSHGMSMSSEFFAWHNMKARCYNPSESGYSHYGGRGITVCERWIGSFENFFEDMGPKPSPEHSIDRINVNGNYDPSNCRWATSKQQGRNTRFNRIITFMGESKCMAEWAETFGLSAGIIGQRLSRGWSVEESISTPPLRQGFKKPSQTACTDQSASLHHQACHA